MENITSHALAGDWLSDRSRTIPAIGLVDCNNFFVSCERLFQPKLCNKPVVVLSNQNGVVVARSQEAKSLGVPMGAIAFEWNPFFKKHNVICVHSSFARYSEISQQVMELLKSELFCVEVYSIDEAFFTIDQLEDGYGVCVHLREKIMEKTKIPVSVGLSWTKTLAKIATHIAKSGSTGVHCLLENIPAVLETIAVEDVWGIGNRIAATLRRDGIYTAYALAQQEDSYLQKKLSVVGVRLAYELRGQPVSRLHEERSKKKSISTARVFPHPLYDYLSIAQVLSQYVEEVTEEMRSQSSKASAITISLQKSDFEQSQLSYTFPQPTHFTPDCITAAKNMLSLLFCQGERYRKVGVVLHGFVPAGSVAYDLFCHQTSRQIKEDAISMFVDKCNSERGKRIMRFGASLPNV